MGNPTDDRKDDILEGALSITSSNDQHEDTKTHQSIGQVLEVQGNTEFIQATTAAPLNPWSRTSLQLYLILLTACLNATASGFDGSIFSTINAMDQYKAYFHKQETGSSTGIIFAIYTIGSMAGAIFTGPVLDILGRRAGMGIGSIIIMIGAVVVTAAQSEAYLLGGRFVLGFGISLGTSAAPTYAIELAPPQWRGRITGYYNTFFYSGAILATGVTYATAKTNSQLAWRLPLGLQCIPPGFILLGSLLIPESPRWLCSRGRFEDARKILAKYHGAGDANHPVVQLEMREFEESIKVQKSRSWWDWRQLIFLFGCAYSFVYTPLTPTYCAETLDNHTRATGMGIHVLMNNTANFYNTYVTAVALDAISWKYYLVFVALNVVYGEQVALEVILRCTDLFIGFLWFFLGVETKGRTLEELQEVFDSKWPPKASLEKRKMVKTQDGNLDQVADCG
ncbi:hypothetical protein PRZ48_011225 [Zasmidium cellare]|uniref:Major facilitator superfamily (MFS) profile domain-containing protein n=1 Tax=Zasmidium cellare TaxID=395010 RepID=A0ABR0EAT5_ZASCE|nr:hypothetical protein PRZ48_011225 [Zasmidium cellare]